MSTYDFIQILAVVAVLVYSGWLASRKNSRKTAKSAQHTPKRSTSDVSPSTAPEPFIEPLEPEEPMEESPLMEEDYLSWVEENVPKEQPIIEGQPALVTEEACAVQQTTVLPVPSEDESEKKEEKEGQRVPDLRTMVIASEILKPKFDEY